MLNKLNDNKESNGFALISIIWFILLGTAIVSIIMLNNIHLAETQNQEQKDTKRRLDLESAYHTVVADILFNGPRSEFAQLPAQTEYQLNNRKMSIKVNSENGKIDIAQADPALISRALAGFGLTASQRKNILDAIAANNNQSAFLWTYPDMLAALEKGNQECLSDDFTVFSGLAQPETSFASARLARALGFAAQQGGRSRPGSALHLQISDSKGLPLNVIFRITGRFDEPVIILDWAMESRCPA